MSAHLIFGATRRASLLLLPVVAAGVLLGWMPIRPESALLVSGASLQLPGTALRSPHSALMSPDLASPSLGAPWSSLQDRRGAIHHAVPSAIDLDARYVIYLHGRIIEDQGLRPTHPEFGVYEYEAILEELVGNGLEVISEVRPPSADAAEYARRAAQQVRELIAAGVPEDHITVMGFSKGAVIAILTSWELQEPAVRYVWMAGCGDWAFRMSALVPTGHVLSIHEASDELGVSCEPLFGRSELIEAEEIRIKTGEKHGAFYRPIPEWVGPAVEWALGETRRDGADILSRIPVTVDYISGRLLLPRAAGRGQAKPPVAGRH
jgi:hypothetical protein